MENFSGKKRPSINLSLFTTLSDSLSSSNSLKSPRNFENGVVGLGIVAAMTGADNNTHESFRSLKSPRSNPVPIVSSAKPAANFRCGLNFERDGDDSDKTDKLSETYACVISHCGSNQIKRRVYFDDNLNYGVENCRVVLHAASSPINIGEMRKDFRCADFLNSCFLCEKELHGLDIFMYRGEKAFCSTDCRDKHIRSDDHNEKCGSEARKPFDYSESPCSGPLMFFAGVAAA